MNPLHFELFPASARPFKSIEFRLFSWKQTKTLSQHTNAKKKKRKRKQGRGGMSIQCQMPWPWPIIKQIARIRKFACKTFPALGRWEIGDLKWAGGQRLPFTIENQRNNSRGIQQREAEHREQWPKVFPTPHSIWYKETSHGGWHGPKHRHLQIAMENLDGDGGPNPKPLIET